MITTLVLASLTTACATHTFTMSQICEAPRKWLARQLKQRMPPLAQLVTCQYCLSHWVALVVLVLTAETWREALWLWLPTVWIASHLLTVFQILLNVIPYWQASVYRPMPKGEAA